MFEGEVLAQSIMFTSILFVVPPFTKEICPVMKTGSERKKDDARTFMENVC